MRMRDDKGMDDKILAVSALDPAYAEIQSLDDLPPHTLREMKRFFQDYKVLENKEVVVDDFLPKADAITALEESLELYRKLRRGEIS